METPLKTTRLHDWHQSAGAHMAAFSGFDMPLWYPAGIRAEHLCVVQAAGLFDTGHMSLIEVAGRGSHALLQTAFTNDLDRCIGVKKTPLVPGRCIYGAFLTPQGHLIDDAILFQVDMGQYLVCVNAGMGPVIETHLKQVQDNGDCAIRLLDGGFGKIDIQGPRAGQMLSRIGLLPEGIFEKFPYFSFKGHFNAGAAGFGDVTLAGNIPVLLSRTGYTGEFGFELFCRPDDTETLWKQLLQAGDADGILPCGLGARDALRAGAVLPLSHQDIGDWPFIHHPWEFALPWTDNKTRFTKSFIGDDLLLKDGDPRYTFAFAGFNPRKIANVKTAVVSDASGAPIGQVLTCTTDMAIDRVAGQIVSIASVTAPDGFKPKGLCCGFVRVDRNLASGDRIWLSEGKKRIAVEIVSDIRPDRTARVPLKTLIPSG